MGSNITLVSGFFDIGRGNLADANVARGVDKYFTYFADWCRMRNKLIVYTEPRYVDEVMRIRAEYGLADLTQVIPVEDIYAIEPEIYARMKEISANQRFCDYRYYKNAMSNQATYDYVMMLKYWCMMDAAKRGLIEDMVAWMDFGFNHSGELFTTPEEFDYHWEYYFEPKIHVFSHKDPDKELGLRNLQLQSDCLMGSPVVVHTSLCEELWNMVTDAMRALNMIDSIDDDQQLLLMGYRCKPELFEIHLSTWFMPLKECGGGHLSCREIVVPKLTPIQKVKRFIKKMLGMTIEEQFIKRIRKELE